MRESAVELRGFVFPDPRGHSDILVLHGSVIKQEVIVRRGRRDTTATVWSTTMVCLAPWASEDMYKTTWVAGADEGVEIGVGQVTLQGV